MLLKVLERALFQALQIIKDAADKAGLTMSEVALRWVSHHSLMKREYGDSVLIGASSLNHIEQVFVSIWLHAMKFNLVRFT